MAAWTLAVENKFIKKFLSFMAGPSPPPPVLMAQLLKKELFFCGFLNMNDQAYIVPS